MSWEEHIGTRPRRAWGSWLTVALLLVVLVAAVVLHSPWLSLRNIEIVGAERVDAAGRLERAGIGPGAVMIWLDTGTAIEAILADPWAAGVTVERVFPHTLFVEVDERTPAVWIQGLDSWMLVGSDGVVVEIATEPGQGVLLAAVSLPDVPVGTHPDEPAWDELVALGTALDGDLGAEARVVPLMSELWLQIPGHRVRLGHPIDLGEKGLVLRALLAEGIEDGATIDLVAPRRPAVSPSPAAQLEGDSAGPAPEDAPQVESFGG